MQVQQLANKTGMDFSLQLGELQEKYDEVATLFTTMSELYMCRSLSFPVLLCYWHFF